MTQFHNGKIQISTLLNSPKYTVKILFTFLSKSKVFFTSLIFNFIHRVAANSPADSS